MAINKSRRIKSQFHLCHTIMYHICRHATFSTSDPASAIPNQLVVHAEHRYANDIDHNTASPLPSVLDAIAGC